MTNRYEEKVIRSSLLAAAEDNHLILFLDGLEEISPSGQSKVTQWLHQLLNEHPSLKMVLTSIPHFSSSLSVLGFENFSISPWAEEDKKHSSINSQLPGLLALNKPKRVHLFLNG